MTENTPVPLSPDLAGRAIAGLAFFMGVMAVMIFLPAGTLVWWQAWVFWIIFSLASLATTLVLLKRDPALVERRIRAGPGAEREASQKTIQTFTMLVLVATCILPGLDHRFGWSRVSPAISLLGDGLVLIGYWFIFRVFRANAFASSTIEVAGDQTVISTGPYGIVRHPMYSASLILFLGVPLALGSWWSLIPTSLFAPLLAWRLTEEEAFLIRNLPGYGDYRLKVRWRLLPLIW